MDHDGDFLHTAGDDPMIAIDIPRKRIYVRGDITAACDWLARRMNEDYADLFYHCPIIAYDSVRGLQAHCGQGWTVEHNPEPL
jgi:hypothetical protein